MIEHIFIKNYKAFRKENIPLDKHTLLIGSNKTGKTTVLEALDLFFNHEFKKEYVLDQQKDVAVEIHINETRYRKTFSPPHYLINYKKCIGDLFDINYLKYLYIPTSIHNPKLLNDILTINMSDKISPEMQAKVSKVSDYIDGVTGNSNYKIFRIAPKFEMMIKENLSYSKEEYTKMVSNITYPHLIVGIDNYEINFQKEALADILKYSYQTIFTTNEKKIVKTYDYHIKALYKGDKTSDYETIQKRLHSGKKYLLVEGKYDVAWFERALELLQKDDEYSVIPCGGSGNIAFVKEQLEKENYQTITITDGDTKKKGSLEKDIIELYADKQYINNRFNTNFSEMPTSKNVFFKHINVKDDVVKSVLSRWAKKNLTNDHQFVKEVSELLKRSN